jgi:hypothetical protein
MTNTETVTSSPILSDRVLLALASAWLLAACLGCRQPSGIGPVFATSSEPPQPRPPDGIAVDPAPELPPSSDCAKTHEPVLVLHAPVPEKAVRAVVSAFFSSVASEDMDALAALLTTDASATGKAKAAAPSLLDYWRARMRRYSYRKIATDLVYDAAEIEIYRYDDLDTVRPGRPIRPPTMIRSDMLARVPIATARVGHDRLFGDEILFVLRLDQGMLRIREASEDFQLP